MTLNADKTKDRFATVIDEAIEVLSRFTIPLYTEGRSGRPVQFGSGFFLNVDNQTILISAAHVLREAKIREVFYYVSRDLICHLDGKIILSNGRGKSNDFTDVGGLVLSKNARLPHAETGKASLPISYLAPRYLPRHGKEYLIVGYPSSQNTANPTARSVTARAYAYHSGPAPKNSYEKLALSSESHILVPLNLRDGRDSSGNHVNFPKPTGISGSPLWVLYEDNPTSAPQNFPLVGIGIEYIKADKLLVATDSQAIVELINVAI